MGLKDAPSENTLFGFPFGPKSRASGRANIISVIDGLASQSRGEFGVVGQTSPFLHDKRFMENGCSFEIFLVLEDVKLTLEEIKDGSSTKSSPDFLTFGRSPGRAILNLIAVNQQRSEVQERKLKKTSVIKKFERFGTFRNEVNEIFESLRSVMARKGKEGIVRFDSSQGEICHVISMELGFEGEGTERKKIPFVVTLNQGFRIFSEETDSFSFRPIVEENVIVNLFFTGIVRCCCPKAFATPPVDEQLPQDISQILSDHEKKLIELSKKCPDGTLPNRSTTVEGQCPKSTSVVLPRVAVTHTASGAQQVFKEMEAELDQFCTGSCEASVCVATAISKDKNGDGKIDRQDSIIGQDLIPETSDPFKRPESGLLNQLEQFKKFRNEAERQGHDSFGTLITLVEDFNCHCAACPHPSSSGFAPTPDEPASFEPPPPDEVPTGGETPSSVSGNFVPKSCSLVGADDPIVLGLTAGRGAPVTFTGDVGLVFEPLSPDGYKLTIPFAFIDGAMSTHAVLPSPLNISPQIFSKMSLVRGTGALTNEVAIPRKFIHLSTGESFGELKVLEASKPSFIFTVTGVPLSKATHLVHFLSIIFPRTPEAFDNYIKFNAFEIRNIGIICH